MFESASEAIENLCVVGCGGWGGRATLVALLPPRVEIRALGKTGLRPFGPGPGKRGLELTAEHIILQLKRP